MMQGRGRNSRTLGLSPRPAPDSDAGTHAQTDAADGLGRTPHILIHRRMPIRPFDDSDSGAAIERAARLSHYARHVLGADPALAQADFGKPLDPAQMAAALEGLDDADEATLDRALRKLRQAVMLRLIVRDLAGRADLAEVIATATALAEHTLAAA
jgi:glutamine synthetase adenylyltransferase